MTLELIADYQCVCGEGPIWHEDEKRLYWTDIETGRMFWFDPASGRHEQCYEGPRVGGMTLQADGSLLLFRDAGNICVWKDGKVQRDIVGSIPNVAENGGRFNDVWPDPEGRVFCGTLGKNCGALYRLDPDGSLHTLLENVGCSNGIDFTPDLKRMYFTDSGARTIDLFDYDQATGSIGNRRNFVSVPKAEGEGVPDGMTIDSAGRVWSARWDGSRCVCHDPQTGEAVDAINLPAKKCSSVVFAGDDLADMYFTTAGGDQKASDGEHAGALFRLRGYGPTGRAMFRSKIGL